MKALWVVILIVACAAVAGAQSYSSVYGAPYSKAYYGAATFKADSHYVWSGSSRWVTVTASLDTTAGTTMAYFCANNDSTNAIPLYYGIGGNWGSTWTYRFYNLRFYRVKGAVPVRVTIE